jgi:hypothetical protein
MSGNFVSLYTSEDLVGTYQVLDTTTNERFNVAACNSGVPTALSSTLAYVNDCTSNELLDFASSGARSSISSKPGGTLGTSNIVSLASGAIGYLAGTGLFQLSSTGTYTELSSDLDNGAVVASFDANANYSVVALANAIHWWANSQSRHVELSGVNLTKVRLKDNKVFYAAETSNGTPISGTLDLAAAAAATDFQVDTKLKDLVPLQQ